MAQAQQRTRPDVDLFYLPAGGDPQFVGHYPCLTHARYVARHQGFGHYSARDARTGARIQCFEVVSAVPTTEVGRNGKEYTLLITDTITHWPPPEPPPAMVAALLPAA